MDERKKKAFDFASDLTKLLITLSTSVIGAVVIFSDSGDLIVKAGPALRWALLVYGLSAIFGGLGMMALTGQLGSPRLTEATSTIYALPVRITIGFQIILFVIATGAFAWAALHSVQTAPQIKASKSALTDGQARDLADSLGRDIKSFIDDRFDKTFRRLDDLGGKAVHTPMSSVKEIEFYRIGSVHGRDIDEQIARVRAELKKEVGSYECSMEIVGHADALGDDQLNIALSRQRATYVADSLSQDPELPAPQIKFWGERRLSNLTLDNRQDPANRRVEIVLKCRD